MKSDLQLLEDVTSELKWEPTVHAGEIDVDTKDGVVTLTGEVCSYPEKWNADSAALRVQGVKELVSDLTVSIPQPQQRRDEAIQRAVETVLEWRSSLSGTDITARVHDGRVTLSGSVKWQYQRLAAEDGVRSLTGVTGVSNDIDIEKTVYASTVQSDIEEALKRTAAADAAKIRVAMDNGAVTLTGTVHSWAEAAAAANSAWGAPGVTNVVDKLILLS